MDTGHYGSHDVTPEEVESWKAEEPERDGQNDIDAYMTIHAAAAKLRDAQRICRRELRELAHSGLDRVQSEADQRRYTSSVKHWTVRLGKINNALRALDVD